jgi:RNA methyltransferase, TrmH family
MERSQQPASPKLCSLSRVAEAASENRARSSFSRSDFTFDFILSLRTREARERCGLFYVEGLRPVSTALDAGLKPRAAFFQGERSLPSTLRDRLTGIPSLRVCREQMAELAMGPGPQGVGLVLDLQWQPLEMQRVRPSSCWLGVECARNPGNLGTIMRAADAVGAEALVVFEPSDRHSSLMVDPHDPAVVRASMGSFFSLKVIRSTHREFRRWKHRWELTVIGASSKAEMDYRRVSYRRPVLLMLGEERQGYRPARRPPARCSSRFPWWEGRTR